VSAGPLGLVEADALADGVGVWLPPPEEGVAGAPEVG